MVAMSRRIIIASVVAGVVAVAAAAGGFAFFNQREQVRLDRAARASADRFASAWSHRSISDTTYSFRTTEQVAASFKRTTSGLGSGPVKVTVTSLTRHGDKAQGRLSVAWTVAEGSTWRYTMPVSLVGHDSWSVVAKDGAAMWAPGVSPTAKLVATRTWGTRGDVLGREGSPILREGQVRDVVIDPARATVQSITELERLVDEPGKLVAKLNAAKASGSKASIFVITYREADFQARKAQLDPLIGVIYPKGLLVAGDYAGLSGLQGQYDGLLAGTPGVKVTASDKPDVPLFEKAAVNGAPMTLTLDPKIQSAAEAALEGSAPVPSALVAVDVKTGDLLAAANWPSVGMNRALQGQYQPGSTLKVATTYSLLGKGLTPSTPVTCPPFVMVDGRKMTNYENETFASAPFSKDFALSCNTAFVQLAAKMGDSDVHDAAAALGIGTGWGKHLGIDGTFSGSVPAATTKTEKAATAFGQARTLVSPASLAVMVASVARGSYIEPALIRTPAVAGADRAPKALDAKVAGELRGLMRLVVTEGTGTALKSAAGGEVFGKTGTAEYGSANPPETRAWFVGWQGDVAFAVLVENGKSGGTVAAPIAKAFLGNLQR